jgi:hypothetical protein
MIRESKNEMNESQFSNKSAKSWEKFLNDVKKKRQDEKIKDRGIAQIKVDQKLTYSCDFLLF